MTRLLLIMLVGVLSSCNVIAPIAAVIEPEDTTARAYRLPNRPCVIFVEDRVGAIGMNLPGVRSRVGKQATAYLLGNEIHSRMIEPDDALRVAQASDRASEMLSLSEIARRCRADLMVNVQVRAWALVGQDGVPRPTATAVVRVLDMNKRQQVFPDPNGDGREGFVVAQLAITDPNKVQSRQDARRVNLELADELGLQVARLFDEYITNPLGQNLR